MALPRERQWRAVHRIATRAEPELRRAVLTAIARTRQAVSTAEVQRALLEGDLADAARAVPWEEIAEPVLRDQFVRNVRDVYEESGRAAARLLPFDASFSITDRRALAFLERAGGERITNISNGTREGVRHVLVEAQRQGLAAVRTARLIKPLVGLTEPHARAVMNRGAELAAQGIAQSTIDARLARYARELIQVRALMIARTEASIAGNAGIREAWEQAADQGLFERDEATRVWIAVNDSATDEDCAQLDGVEVGMDESFPDDAEPPLHPSCRCVVVLRPQGRREAA
jgi:hypothetical protein